MYNTLVENVNNIDTTGFVLKTKYNTGKSSREREWILQTKVLLIVVVLQKEQIIMLRFLRYKTKYLVVVA